MGSAAFKPLGIQNKIEIAIRQKEIDSREKSQIKLDENSKVDDVDRELLGAISKLSSKRTRDNPFDPITPDMKEQKIPPQQDGLVIILCKDIDRKMKIKASLKEFFQNADAIRWPDFKFVGNSLHVGSRASMCHKVIGYTSFFLFYGVIPDSSLSQSELELDINRTVDYFNQNHRGALQDVPKFFIFEGKGKRVTLAPWRLRDKSKLSPVQMNVCHKVEQDANGTTVFVVSNEKNHSSAIDKVAENEFVLI